MVLFGKNLRNYPVRLRLPPLHKGEFTEKSVIECNVDGKNRSREINRRVNHTVDKNFKNSVIECIFLRVIKKISKKECN